MKKRILLFIDILLLIGWTVVGLLNLIFFIIHASPASISGLIEGNASISFAFMTASSIFMLLISAAAFYIAFRRREVMDKIRAGLPWRIARGLLTLFALFFISVEIIIINYSFPKPVPETSELLILGAHVRPDGLSVTLHNRLAVGAAYANGHPDVQVFVSGGQGLNEPISEAAAMRDFLVTQGVSEDRIRLEDQSHNTFENMVYTYRMLPIKSERRPIIIVTSEFHICRASMLASRAGFEPYFIPAPTPRSLLLSSYSREFFGLIKSYLFDR